MMSPKIAVCGQACEAWPLVQYIAPDHQKVYVVGDIHGCYTLLMHQLKQLQFDFEKDLLIGVGDLIDKGPESWQCLQLLQQHWFRMVRGNHEQLCIQGSQHPYFKKLHQKYGGEWFYQLRPQQQAQIIACLKQLPVLIQLNFAHKTVGIAHGDIGVDDWNLLKQTLELSDHADQASYAHVLWGRSRIRDEQKYGTVRNIDEIYLGHTIVAEVLQKHNCFFIDTGAYQSQQLTILQVSP